MNTHTGTLLFAILSMKLIAASAPLPGAHAVADDASARSAPPAASSSTTPETTTEAPAIPALPAEIAGILSIEPFTLDQGYEFDWRKERPIVTSGYILVLKVDPALVYPRQTAEPILYVGTQTAEKINIGAASGRLLVIVPSTRKEDGSFTLDLSRSPIWFGEPGLPEQVDAAIIQQQRDIAQRNKITSRPTEELAKATAFAAAKRADGDKTTPAHFADKNALLRSLAAVVREHASDEGELATALEMQGG